MKRLLILASLVALCGVVPAIALAQMSSPDHVTIWLNAQNDSGETGAATLAQDNKDVLVFVRTTNGTSATQPIHIHEGTCDKLNPVPKYPLSALKDGRSSTRLKNMELSSLLSSPFAINIHDSPNNVKKYVACGNISAKY